MTRGERAVGYLLVALLLSGTVAWVATGAEIDHPTPEAYNESKVEAAALDRINDARENHGLPSLQQQAAVDDRTTAWTATMAADGDLRHGDVRCRPGAENVALTHWRREIQTDSGTVRYESPAALGRGLANQWLNSSAHRANILDRRFRTTGIDVKRGEESEVYATQRFC